MDIGELAVFQEIVDRTSSDEPREHLYIVLSAIHMIQQGASSLHQSNPGGITGLLEQMLGELRPISGVEVLHAMLHLMLLGEYATAGRYKEAIANGQAALPVLMRETRLAYSYAACLHDIGGVLFESGHLSEGVDLMEQAVSIYDNLPDRSRGAIPRGNLERMHAAMGQRNKKQPIWLRLFRQ